MIVVLLCNFPQNVLFIIVFMFVTCTPVRVLVRIKNSQTLNTLENLRSRELGTLLILKKQAQVSK